MLGQNIGREVGLHFTAAPPLEVIRQGTGLHLRLNYTGAFVARITGGSNPYSWEEVSPIGGGAFDTPAIARSGTTSVNPAYEINGNTKVASGTYVFMALGGFNFGSAGQEYLFDLPASTTGSSGGGGGDSATCGLSLHADLLFSDYDSHILPFVIDSDDTGFTSAGGTIHLPSDGFYLFGAAINANVAVADPTSATDLTLTCTLVNSFIPLVRVRDMNQGFDSDLVLVGGEAPTGTHQFVLSGGCKFSLNGTITPAIVQSGSFPMPPGVTIFAGSSFWIAKQ